MSDSDSFYSEESTLSQKQIDELTKALMNPTPDKAKTRNQKSASKGKSALKGKSGMDALVKLTLKVSAQNDKMLANFEKMESVITNLGPQLANLQNQIDDLQARNASLEAENSDLKGRVDSIETRQDELEQLQLKNCLVAEIDESCLHRGVNPVQVAFATLRNELGLTEDILRKTYVRRLGKDTKFLIEAPDNLAKLFVNAARSVKSDKIYINEFLTKTRSKLFYEVRKLQKSNPELIASTYVKDGRIYVRRPDETRGKQISTLEEVTAMRAENPDVHTYER